MHTLVPRLSAAVTIFALVTGSCVPLPIGVGLQARQVVDGDGVPQGGSPSLKDWHASGGVHFLLVHGMNNHPFGMDASKKHPNYLGNESYAGLQKYLGGWDTLSDTKKKEIAGVARRSQFGDFIGKYTERAGITVDPDQEIGFSPIFDPKSKKATGYLMVIKGVHDETQHPVTFDVVCWSVAAAVRKESIYGAWSDSQQAEGGMLSDFKLDRHRSGINRDIRRNVVVWGLTDASLYMKAEIGREFEWCVSKGFKTVLEGMKPDDKLAIVTHSLGSTITVNVLNKLVSEEEIANSKGKLSQANLTELKGLFREGSNGMQTDRTKMAFYMFANQYGLVTGGNDVEVIESAAEAATGGSRPVPIPLVSFTDPDDLLSMPLPAKSSRHVSVQNVYVRNNWLVLGIPIAGRATDPLGAHTAYGKNPAVLKVMLEGE